MTAIIECIIILHDHCDKKLHYILVTALLESIMKLHDCLHNSIILKNLTVAQIANHLAIVIHIINALWLNSGSLFVWREDYLSCKSMNGIWVCMKHTDLLKM